MKTFTKPRLLLVLISLLAFLGFLDSTFLTIKHFQGTLPPCTLALGCEKVLTSQYATVAGIPIALLGSVFYLIVMVIAILILQNSKFEARNPKYPKSTCHSVVAQSQNTNNKNSSRLRSNNILRASASESRSFEHSIFDVRILFLLIFSGFLVSLALFLIQAFVLQAFCQYCIASEIITTLLLIFSMVMLRSKQE